MAVLLIVFEVEASDVRRYIVGHIQSYPAWCRLSAGAYALRTEKSAGTIYSELRRFLEADDQLYIAGLTRPVLGFGPETVNDWLDTQIPVR